MTTNQLLRIMFPLLAAALFVAGCLVIGDAVGWEDLVTVRGILAFAGAVLLAVLLAIGMVGFILRRVHP